MPDLKYGRVFTENDVRRLMQWAFYMGQDPDAYGLPSDPIEAFERVEGRVFASDQHREFKPLAFPANEPLFLLRGQDIAAPEALDGYAFACINAGHEDGDDKRGRLIPHVEQVEAAETAFRIWQGANPDRVKRPG